MTAFEGIRAGRHLLRMKRKGGSKTAAERRHMSRVAALGCLICGRPAELHHIRSRVGAARKASHFEVIPLCPSHHRTGGHGVAFHAGKQTWERNFGTERDLLARVLERVSG